MSNKIEFKVGDLVYFNVGYYFDHIEVEKKVGGDTLFIVTEILGSTTICIIKPVKYLRGLGTGWYFDTGLEYKILSKFLIKATDIKSRLNE
jgi:hypothetical protein